jgi:sugar lactone lactonase YvrE
MIRSQRTTRSPFNALPSPAAAAISPVLFSEQRVRVYRVLCLLAAFAAVWCSIPRVQAQAFLAEWTAAANGGVTPTGMALSTENAVTYLYVSDQPRGRVLKLDATTGAVVSVIGKPGNASGDLTSPHGVARDPVSGDLYIAERGNHRISRFTTAGTFVMSWGLMGPGPGQFNEPVGVAVDATGAVYVTDHANHRVQKFTVAQNAGVWSATYVTAWGVQGSGNGQFNLPYGITADSAGNIWVADGANGRVQRFNTGGVYQSTLGSLGTAPGQFILATGFGIAPSGELFVTSTHSNPQDGALADANNQWISRFTSAGVFTSRWGGAYGQAAGQFRLPYSVVVGANNRAYVADLLNNRIQVFNLSTDSSAPTVATFTVGTANPTTVNFLITFSEPVSGVNAADFTALAGGGAGATIGTVTGGGAAYTVPVNYTGAAGTIRLDLNATGTGITDTSGNALGAGATGPVFTINGTSTTQVIGITPPPNGTYGKNEQLIFVVRFNANVTLAGGKPPGNNPGKGNDDDDDDDESSAYFTWSAVSALGQSGDSGKAHYVSGSGTNALTFRLKVHNGDLAPAGIMLGNVIRLDDDAVIRDANGVALDAQRLTLPWTQNPLSGVILNAPKPGNGNGGNGNNGNGHGNNGNGNGNGNGKGRSDRLVNLSSRLRVIGGDASRSVVAGFVVTGAASKQILIRAVGPGLAGFGVRDALAQPVLVLRDSTGKTVAENDGWKNLSIISAAGDLVGAFKLAQGSRDAALLVTLAPGAYTALVTANGNGIVLVEVYDTVSGTELSTEQIVNISTRGYVGTGDDVLVAGFVVTGGAPKQVLIRGIGPALAAFGVPGVLQDPVLKVYSGGGNNLIAQNDNWEAPQPIGAQVPTTAAQITAASTSTGAFPLSAGGKDAAIIVTLAPGSYSAVVSGLNNGTGAGLVEVYELP